MKTFVTVVILLALATASSAYDSLELSGNVRIIDGGAITFPDGTTQSTAIVQGPAGQQGPKGDAGTPGSAVSKDAICQVYAEENLPAPPFCGKKIIFHTSSGTDGNMGGLAGADQLCQTAASIAGLAGTFKAWLSDSTTPAADRLTHSNLPYVRTDGAVVANNWLDLVDGFIKEPILCDETSDCSALTDFATYYPFWSNTQIDGSIDSTAHHCSDWTSNSDTVYGNVGSLNEIGNNTTRTWTSFDDGTCSIGYVLVCIEQ